MDSNETNIFQIDEDLASSLQELDIDELQGFAELHANHEDDSQTEMFIYACFQLCRRTGAREWAEKALLESEKWLASTPLDDGQYPRRYQIDRFIASTAKDFGHTLEGDEAARSKISKDFFYGNRYKLTGAIEDLNETIKFLSYTLSQLPPRHPGMSTVAMNLAKWHMERFEKDEKSNLDNLKVAIEAAQPIMDTNFPDTHARAHWLSLLGNWLRTLYHRENDPHDLDRAIDAFQSIYCLPFECDSLHAKLCVDIGNCLLTRSQRTGDTKEFHEATLMLEYVLKEPALDQSQQATVLNSLGICSTDGDREPGPSESRESGHDKEISHAEDPQQENPQSESSDIQARPPSVENMIEMIDKLARGPESASSMTHLDETIEEIGLALQGEDSVDVHIVGALVHLEARLVERFQSRRATQDLNRALKVAGIAVQASPNDWRRGGLLNRLSNNFALHFEYTKDGEDLNQAVELAEQAVIITPPGYDGRAVGLANFGNQLLGRFRNFGRREDLAHGHRVLSEALELTPTSDRFWRLIMGNLAISYGESFEHTKDKEDLNRAIEISLKLLPSFSNEDPVRAIVLANLAMFLRKRSFCNFELGDDMINMYHIIEACVKKTIPVKYRYTVEEIDDIERAVDLMVTAIGIVDFGSVKCGQLQHHLASFIIHRCYMLLTRPESSHDMLSDLNHAIDLEEIALNAILPDNPEHPDRAAGTIWEVGSSCDFV